MAEEQPIDVHQYTRALKHALPWIVLLALVAAAAAVTSSLFRSKTYTASTTILARDMLASGQFTDVNTVTRRLATVNLLTRTTRVLSRATGRLPGITVDEARSAVHSSVDPQANVITITVKAKTPSAAAALANGVATSLIATERGIEQQVATDARHAALAQVARLRAEASDKSEIQAAEARLASLAADAVGAAGGFQVVQPAVPPSRPSSPSPWLSGVVAFLAIALLGMLAVLAREQLSPRASSAGGLDELLSMPVLASIPVARRVGGRDLPLLPPAVREAFYVLASAVRLDARRHGTRVVIVTSALPREGRTTVAANLARALSLNGNSVLAVSGDLRAPRLHEVLDVSRSPGLTDVLAANRDDGRLLEVADAPPSYSALERAIHTAPASSKGRLHVLPSGSAAEDPAELLFGESISGVFNGIRALPYDFIVVDGPPGLGVPDLQALVEHADAILVVARADRLRTGDAAELRERLGTFAIAKLGIAVIERASHNQWRYQARGELEEARADGEHEVVALK